VLNVTIGIYETASLLSPNSVPAYDFIQQLA